MPPGVDGKARHHRTAKENESGGMILLGGGSILRRTLFHFFGAIIAANRDLFAADLDLDSAVIDIPIANRAFCRVHMVSFHLLHGVVTSLHSSQKHRRFR